MTETQKLILVYLKEIDALCRANNIDYYLAGGTLMGAVRHEGFLPWDDDADILMTRDNWLRFVDLFREGAFPDNRVLVGPEINDSYPNVFGRYVDTTNTAIHTNQFLDDQPAGMPIDIFPLDPVPSDPDVQRKYLEDIALYSEIRNNNGQYSIRLCCNRDRFNEAMELVKTGREKELCKELENSLFQYKEEECDIYALRWAGCGLFSKKSIYGHAKDIRFEDAILMGPQEPEEYLFWHYGPDWMMVPSVEEREAHNAIYNFGIDYKTMREKHFSKIYDRQKMSDAVWHRKITRFNRMDDIHNKMDAFARLKAANAIAMTEKALKDAPLSVEQMLENGDYPGILRLFGAYVAFASSRECIGREDFDGVYRLENPIKVDIGQDYFEAVITSLYYTGQMGRATRMLDAYERQGGKMTKPLQQAREFIAEVEEADLHFWKKQYPEALPFIDDLLQRYPDNQHLLYMKTYIMIQMKEDASAIRDLLSHAQDLYPEDGELYKCFGDFMVSQNRIRDALIAYYKSSLLTANGCLALEIRHWAKDNVDRIRDVLDEDLVRYVETDESITSVIANRKQRKSRTSQSIREAFLDYICLQTGYADSIVAEKYMILIALENTPEGLAKIGSDMFSDQVIHNPEREKIREAQLLKAGVLPEKIADYLNWDEAYISGDLKTYIDEMEQREMLDAVGDRLLADAYMGIHKISTAFGLYRKALDSNPDPYTKCVIDLIFETESNRIRREMAEGSYPKHILQDAYYKRFGESIL